MPASQEQKVDFLLKKIGYSASKTGIAEDESTISSGSNTAKKPFEEGIPSPFIIPSTSLWSDSTLIPTTPPGSDTAYVKVYSTSSALRMTRDSTVGTNTRTYIAYTTYNNTSSARLTNWIDTQFGANYIVKVYKGDPNSSGVELQQAGANAGTDSWFFDYSSGILNFNGENIPSGITATNIYIVGYRYTGGTGAQPPAGIGTFKDLEVERHLSVGGISTFTGNIDANGDLDVDGHTNLDNLSVAGISTFGVGTSQNTVKVNHNAGYGLRIERAGKFLDFNGNWGGQSYGAISASHGLRFISGTSSDIQFFNNTVEAVRINSNGNTNFYKDIDVDGISTLGNIGISTGRITGPAITYIDPATVGDDTGTLVVKGNLQVEGTQTVVNSSTMTVADKNIELAKGAANDAAVDGAGITIDSGDGDKTWQWVDATDSWTSSEHIRIPDGKVFGFTPDTNTFISRPAADTIAFTHGGSEKVRITDDGSVGIGTDNPTSLLHLEGTGGTTSGLKFENGAGKNVTFYLNNNNISSQFSINYGGTGGSDIQISHNGQVVLAPSGLANIGIGTYTPLYKLDVRGSVGGFDDLRAPHSATVKTYTVTVATKDATHRYPAGGDSSSNGYKIDGEFSPFITLTPGRTYRFEQSDSSNNNHPIIFYLEADKTTEYTTGVTYYADGAKATSSAYNSAFNAATTKYTQIVVGDETPVVLHYQCYNHGYMGHAVQVNSNVVNTNYDALLRGNLNVSGITTTGGLLDINAGGQANTFKVEDLTSGRVVFAGTGGELEDSNNLRFDGTNLFVSGINVTNPGTGITSIIGEDIVTRHLKVTGISTFTGNIDANGDLDVDGHTNLDNVSVAGVSTFNDHVKINDDKFLALGDNQDFRIYHNSSNSFNFIQPHNNGPLLFKGASALMAKFEPGATSILYFNNAVKIKTTNTGINVTGDTETDTLNTGNATFTGSVSAGSTTGTDGYYLKSTGIGVTWAAFPSSRTGLTTTATAGQTTFNFSYNIGFVDVFVNGVKLPSSEFTASNGSTIVLDDAAFANDTLEFISLNTLPVTSGGGAQNLTGLADVTISGTPVIGETLQHNGSVFVNDYTVSATTTSTSQAAILNLPIATYRSVEYTIQVTEGTKYHVTKVLAIHDGTNVSFNEFGTLTTSTSLSTFALDVNSGNMRLLATPASTNSTVFKVKFTGIKV